MPSFSLQATADALEARIRANRLLTFAQEWTRDWVYPYFSGLSLYNLAQSVPHLLGVSMPNAAPLDAAVWGDDDPSGQIDRVVLFLSDGLGYKLLQQFIADDPEFADLVAEVSDGRGAVPLTSISPSTTVAALNTLWTAQPPAVHGVVGLAMLLRQFSMPIYMLSYAPLTGQHPAGTFETWGLDPATFIPVPGLAELLAASSVETHLLLEKGMVGTGLSKLLHRGVQPHYRHTHTGFTDFWLRLHDVLTLTKGRRSVVQIYYHAFDTIAHAYGADTVYTRHEAKQQFAQLRALFSDPALRDGRTLVLIFADHGHHNAGQVVHLAEQPEARAIHDALRLGMTGEPRMGYLTLRDGLRAQVIDTLDVQFSDALAWVDSTAALNAGLFGTQPPYAEVPHRIGDLIVFPREGWLVTDARMPKLVSWHGGLTDWEMLIPLLVKRL